MKYQNHPSLSEIFLKVIDKALKILELTTFMKYSIVIFSVIVIILSSIVTAKDLSISVYLDNDVFLGRYYNSLFRIENLNYSQENPASINVSAYYNITRNNSVVKEDYFFLYSLNKYKTAGTGSMTFNQSGDYSLCGLIINSTATDSNPNNDFVCMNINAYDTRSFKCNISINATTDKFVYNNNEQIKIHNKLSNSSFFYTIEYWIEDLFGEIIKKRYNTTNQNQKTYTAKINELDRVYVLRNRIAMIGCNNTSSKTSDEKYVIIKGSKKEAEQKSESEIIIENVKYNSKANAQFGEKIDVELSIYKGNTLKKVVYVWIENSKGTDISYKTKASIKEKYSTQELTLPVQLKPNCNKKYNDGEHTLVVEGLGIIKDKAISIIGTDDSLCEEVKDDNEQVKQETIIEKSDNEKNNAGIKSFYTRAKVPEKSINIYASIENPEGKTLLFESASKTESFNLNKDNKSVKIATGIHEGKNIFSLKLYENNELIDESVLSKEFEKTQGAKTEEPIKNNTMYEITGMATKNNAIIYESPGRKSMKLLPYFMICFMAVVSAYFVFKKA